MANSTGATRKDHILQILQDNKNEWVNGDRLATAQTGGNRFGARLEELRKDGWTIESRRNPDPRIAQWQYKIVIDAEKSKPGFWSCTMCGTQVDHEIAKTWRGTLDPRYVVGKCFKCKKERMFKSFTSA